MDGKQVLTQEEHRKWVSHLEEGPGRDKTWDQAMGTEAGQESI